MNKMTDIYKGYITSQPRTGIGTNTTEMLHGITPDETLRETIPAEMLRETSPPELTGAEGDNLQRTQDVRRWTSTQIRHLYSNYRPDQNQLTPMGDNGLKTSLSESGSGKNSGPDLEKKPPLYSFSQTVDFDEWDDDLDLPALSTPPDSKFYRSNSGSSTSSEEGVIQERTEESSPGVHVYACELCTEGESPPTRAIADFVWPQNLATPALRLTPQILIREGHEGSVFKVEDAENLYALKVSAEDCLQNECSILKELKHNNVVKILGHCEKFHEFRMEFLPDQDLETRAKKKGLKEEEVVETFIQVTDGLRYIHSKDIIHCDLKGANILLKGHFPQEFVAKIADFGISVRLNGKHEHLVVRGTKPFMAPEVIDKQLCSKASDVYSIGCCMIEVLTGKHPTKNKKNELPTDISNALECLLQRCLSNEKDNRPSAEDLHNELTRHCQSRPRHRQSRPRHRQSRPSHHQSRPRHCQSRPRHHQSRHCQS